MINSLIDPVHIWYSMSVSVEGLIDFEAFHTYWVAVSGHTQGTYKVVCVMLAITVQLEKLVRI